MIRCLLYQAIKLGTRLGKCTLCSYSWPYCSESLWLPPQAVPKNPQASLRSHSTTTGIREIALVTDSFQNQKQKPPSCLLHKAAELTQAKPGMTRSPYPQALGVCASPHSPATSKPSTTRYGHHGKLVIAFKQFYF